MDLTATERYYGIRVRPGKQLIDRLEAEVTRFEVSYGVSSVVMRQALQEGRRTETEALSKWMQSYGVLTHLRNGYAKGTTGTTGTPSRTIGISTSGT